MVLHCITITLKWRSNNIMNDHKQQPEPDKKHHKQFDRGAMSTLTIVFMFTFGKEIPFC